MPESLPAGGLRLLSGRDEGDRRRPYARHPLQGIRPARRGVRRMRDNLKELYCAETVPPCGTFETHVENTFVPLLRAVVDAEQNGGDAAAVQAAAAAVVPKPAKATSLVAPCRRGTARRSRHLAAAGRSRRSAPLSIDSRRREKRLPALPQGALNALLSSIRDTPLCDMYSDEHEEGFVDPAQIPRSPEDQCGWCGANDRMPSFVEEYLADSLINGMFGWFLGEGEHPRRRRLFLARRRDDEEAPAGGGCRKPQRTSRQKPSRGQW